MGLEKLDNKSSISVSVRSKANFLIFLFLREFSITESIWFCRAQ